MWIYYTVFIVAFLLCPLDYTKNQVIKGLVFAFFCGILIFLPAFKGIGIDNDSGNYKDIFESANRYSYLEILSGNYWENIERLFFLLNKIVGTFGGNISTVFAIVAVITGLANYSFFYKTSPFPFTTLLCYLSFFYLYRDFTQVRYGLSCALVFWSCYQLFEGKYLQFIVLLILAIGFHNAAFIFIIAIPFIYLLKKKIFYIILPFFCTIGFFINPLPLMLGVAGVPEHMLIYLTEEGGAGLILSLIGFVIVLLYFVVTKSEDLNRNDELFDKYFRLVSLGVSLNLLFVQSAIFQRFSYILFQFIVILIPVTLYASQKLKDRFYYVLVHLILISFFLYYGCRMVKTDLIRPYQTENQL